MAEVILKCPECVKNGRRSRVTIGTGITTLAYSPPFYDEDGRYHAHDPNTTTVYYSCSNGHIWIDSRRSKCWCEQS